MPTVSGIVVSTGLSGDGRRTLRDIVDELSMPVNSGDEKIRALAAESFRSAVRVMNRKGLWPWEILQTDVIIQQNQQFSSVGCLIKKPLAMHLFAGGTWQQSVDWIPYDRFVEAYNPSIPGAGPIVSYTIPNFFETGQIQWFPVPSSDGTARFDFYRVTPAPRVEDEPVEIPDYAIEVYMSRAWYELSKRLTSGQRPMAIDVALAEFRLAFREISAHIASPGDRSRWVGPYGW